MIKITPKEFTCKKCLKIFNDLDADKVCSNCFACTGCEIFICPHCGNEITYKPVKQMKQKSTDN